MQEPDSRNNDERKLEQPLEEPENDGCWQVLVTIVLTMVGVATLVFGICLASFR